MTKIEPLAHPTPAKRSFLARLRRNTAGNTLVMMGMGMIPLAGMIGSAVDMSRAYLVKTRLQQACDAGALAGRKHMAGTVLTDADKDEARRFFFFNYKNGALGTNVMSTTSATADDRLTVSLTSENQLGMEARTKVPTSVMSLFGMTSIPVIASCMGEEYYINNDVMLVLDTTGSMNCSISDSLTCGQVSEKSNSKMLDMRNALKTLYTNLRPAQTALEAKGLRLRYGFVQYSVTVNVGALVYAQNSAYINNPSSYYNSGGSLYSVSRATSPNWYTKGVGAGGWEGCIQEVATDATMASTATSIPAAAKDMDPAFIPTSGSGWSPYDAVSEQKDGGQWYQVACPAPAKLLKSWTSAEFNTQVDTIATGDGSTYHDIGMNWGVRMLANTGIFGASNPDTYNAVRVARTIVLMTDGTMSNDGDSYTAYSPENAAHRIAPSGTSANEVQARHEKRLQLMCSKAKSLSMDIWVIAVLPTGTAMPTNLSGCANSGQAKLVSNTTELTAAFRAISDKVGNLRLGQ